MLPIIPQDKANHFIYGVLIGIVAGAIATKFKQPVIPASVLAAVLFGVAKETVDYLSNRKAIAAGLEPTHGVEFADAAFTALGGIASVVLIVIRG